MRRKTGIDWDMLKVMATMLALGTLTGLILNLITRLG